jgi:glycosyltransferase involved in cell wall biosynthesis
MKSARVLVVVPAFNEQEALPLLLAELAQTVPHYDVVVVDDGSSDETAEVAEAQQVLVLRLPVNLGVGGAMRAGYRWGVRNGYDYVVQVDADGQHNPADIDTVLAPVLDNTVDVCVGARFAGVGDYESGGLRRLAMRGLSVLVSAIVGTKLTDTTSGFKAANRKAMLIYSQDFPMEYLGDTVEALIIGHKARLRIGQVPVAMRPRQGGAPSQAPWRAAVFLVRAVLAVFVALTRRASKVVES